MHIQLNFLHAMHLSFLRVIFDYGYAGGRNPWNSCQPSVLQNFGLRYVPAK